MGNWLWAVVNQQIVTLRLGPLALRLVSLTPLHWPIAHRLLPIAFFGVPPVELNEIVPSRPESNAKGYPEQQHAEEMEINPEIFIMQH